MIDSKDIKKLYDIHLTKNEIRTVLQALESYYMESIKEDWDCLPYMINYTNAFVKLYNAIDDDRHFDLLEDYKEFDRHESKDDLGYDLSGQPYKWNNTVLRNNAVDRVDHNGSSANLFDGD